jgi:sialate O-acetylesterase
MLSRTLIISALLLTLAQGAAAQDGAPSFAGIFSDHAVLQRDKPLRIWGTATPSQHVQVSLGSQDVGAQTDATGHWQVDLAALPAGGPYTLSVRSESGSKSLRDIVIGDVFLCSGQSNMEFKVKWSTDAWGGAYMPVNENLRFVTIAQDAQTRPLNDFKTPPSWKVAGPESSGDASAVCYYMASTIQAQQNIPVGMINSYWGGTVAQAWVSEAGLRALHAYDAPLDELAYYARSPDAARAAWIKRQSQLWQASEPDVKTKLRWIAPNFDDTGWNSLIAEGSWENSGDPALKNFDGIVWYRQEITLTKAQAKQAARLNLGPIDDTDITWVNGVNVGAATDWQTQRSYVLGRNVLKAGKNVIVVRVLDNGGGGGLWGKPEDRKIVFADGTAKTLAASWKYKISGQVLPGGVLPNEPWAVPNGLTGLYNGMIAPVMPYHIKAVAWYQGESNIYDPQKYARLLPALMADWRQGFAQPDLPFLVVQLANFGAVATETQNSKWAQLRDVQRRVVEADPHAALSVSVDFGDRSSIHPAQKAVIGQRLARNARAIVYHENVTPGGPQPTEIVRDGKDLIVKFKDTNGGLVTYSSDTAIGFETCAQDVCKYVTATASGDTVVLKDANSAGVTHVRYAWADAPIVNLYSRDDLPAVPFELAVTP